MESDETPLSATEWQVMSAVWELREASATAVGALLHAKFGRAYSEKTAGILLSRLAKKGLLRYSVTRPEGPGRRAHLYSPLLSRERALRLQFARFLKDHSIEAHEISVLQSVLAQLY